MKHHQILKAKKIFKKALNGNLTLSKLKKNGVDQREQLQIIDLIQVEKKTPHKMCTKEWIAPTLKKVGAQQAPKITQN